MVCRCFVRGFWLPFLTKFFQLETLWKSIHGFSVALNAAKPAACPSWAHLSWILRCRSIICNLLKPSSSQDHYYVSDQNLVEINWIRASHRPRSVKSRCCWTVCHSSRQYLPGRGSSAASVATVWAVLSDIFLGFSDLILTPLFLVPAVS